MSDHISHYASIPDTCIPLITDMWIATKILTMPSPFGVFFLNNQSYFKPKTIVICSCTKTGQMCTHVKWILWLILVSSTVITGHKGVLIEACLSMVCIFFANTCKICREHWTLYNYDCYSQFIFLSNSIAFILQLLTYSNPYNFYLYSPITLNHNSLHWSRFILLDIKVQHKENDISIGKTYVNPD